jgi:glycosyltransferase involved in cell wall biosynthesis
VFVNRYFDPDESATSQMLTDLTRSLATQGLRVRVVCSRQLYTDAGACLPRTEMRGGVEVERVATTRFGRARLAGRAMDYASFYAAAAIALWRHLEAGDVLIAKTDPPLIGVVCAAVARLKGARLVNWQQDVFPEVATRITPKFLPRWIDRLLKRGRDWSMRVADVNVLISPRMLEHYRARGIAPERLRVIENWADAAIKAQPPATSRLRRRLGLEHQLVVCYSGNLGRAHEFDTLAGAAELLRDDPRIVFLIVGGGARMAALETAVAERALESFRFLPYQPRAELSDSLAAADVHLVSLLPPLEGLILPSKLYGILAAGRPVAFIGDAEGDIARLLRESGAGVQVDVGAPAALAAALRQLRAEPALCAIMGERARAIFEQRYTLAHAVERWRAVLAVTRGAHGAGASPPELSG